jgi:hypothetical protein
MKEKTMPELGPQNELIHEERKLVPFTGTLGDFTLTIKPSVDEFIKKVLALSPEDYAAVIWSPRGHIVKQALQDSGYHDADVPGGRLCPPWRDGAPE